MLVAEKTHHINSYIYGRGADYLISILKEHMPELEVFPSEKESKEEDELSDVHGSGWYREITKSITPGIILKIRRENKGWTQAELSERCGIAIPNISLMEAGKRNIGIRSARKLADSLGCNVADFII
ncbi:MAG: helix-turn-helix transcriptional regulator [Lachnospiraceae bacterium]|nr:helix-turn-helix transcriptional regulator [Lachnospiraceae bacterium]